MVFAGVLLWGIGTGSNWVKSTVMLQTLAPDGYLGRLTAIDLLASGAAVSAGAVAGACVIDAGGPAVISPMLGVVLGAIAFALLNLGVGRLHNSLASAKTMAWTS